MAIAAGIVLGGASARQTFRLSFHFGLFQFLMPLAGWAAGRTIERWISGYDHWIAFGLLAAIGAKMISDGTVRRKEKAVRDPTRGVTLVVLSLATSIDASAVGLSLGVLDTGIWYSSVVIGLVCAVMTAAGMRLGRPLGARFGKRMEIAGGALLVAIGLRVLAAHLAR